MTSVLNKRWSTMGWRPLDPDDAEIMAIAFIEQLDRFKVPYRHYQGVYNRALDMRASRLAQGMKCDDFSVDLMIAAWAGLEREIRDAEVRSGRFLPSTAASQCPRCYGLGLETVYDDEGNDLGSRQGCKHAPVEEGEGLWKRMQRDRAAVEIVGDVAEPTIDTALALVSKFKAESCDALFKRLCIEIRKESLTAIPVSAEAHEWHSARPDRECDICLTEAWKRMNRAWDYAASRR